MAFIAGGGWFTGTYPVQVPYEFEPAILSDPTTLSIFEAGRDMWNAVTQDTGLELIPRTNEPAFLLFRRATTGGCSAHVGKQQTQPQIVVCNIVLGASAVAHEIGHAIGFLHEHQRPDRDQNITVTDQVPGSGASNGPQHQVIPELTPLRNIFTVTDGAIATVVDDYDCASIMHYPVGVQDGARVAIGAGCATLANAQTSISPGDILGVRALYGGGAGAINVTYSRFPIKSDGHHLTRSERARRKALRRRRGLRGTLFEEVEARRNPPAGSVQPAAPAGFYDDVFARKRELSGFPIFFGYDFEARDTLVYWEF